MRTLQVHSLTAAQRQAMAPIQPRDSTAPAWRLEMPNARLAILRMPDWALYDSQWDWRGFLAQSFSTLAARKVPALVIDLRGNEGGLDVGSVLQGYLSVRALGVPPMRKRVRYRRLPASLAPFVTTWDASFRDWGARAVEDADDARFYTLRDAASDDAPTETSTQIAPRAPHFAGNVFVLIGAENSSATFEFAQRVQANGLATLVGQPTGGNLRGINGSAFFFRAAAQLAHRSGPAAGGPVPFDRTTGSRRAARHHRAAKRCGSAARYRCGNGGGYRIAARCVSRVSRLPQCCHIASAIKIRPTFACRQNALIRGARWYTARPLGE